MKIHQGVCKHGIARMRNRRPAYKVTALSKSRKKISCRMRPQCQLNEKEAVPLCRLDERKRRELQSVARQRERNQESSENEDAHRYEI